MTGSSRLLGGAVLLLLVGFISLELLLVADLYAFEIQPLWHILGPSALLMVVIVNAGVLVAAWACVSRKRVGSHAARRVASAIMLSSLLAVLLVADWVFLEVPVTARAAAMLLPDRSVALSIDNEADFTSFSLTRRAKDAASREVLRLMYARTVLNTPEVFDAHRLGKTIDEYSRRYRIPAEFLFFRAYLISWYGEAASGPVPFLRATTAEGIRDLVQIHLPGWFVESRLRGHLVSSALLPKVFGADIGDKLRYALHKATLDVSAQPYDLSTYSDVFLVLKAYPSEFPDVLSASAHGPLRMALRDSFRELHETALVEPYEQPYRTLPYGHEYYASHRDALKRFARAAYYLTVLDLDFATRVQSLLSDHQRTYYRDTIGADQWESLPEWQQVAMLAMVRDLFLPNVGRFAYNLYALPELNCTPLAFVAEAAREDRAELSAAQRSLWRPENSDVLWGGAGFHLRNLNAVWSLVNAEPIPGVTVNESAEAASRVLGLPWN